MMGVCLLQEVGGLGVKKVQGMTVELGSLELVSPSGISSGAMVNSCSEPRS